MDSDRNYSPIVIAQSISKLIGKIQGDKAKHDSVEIKLLKEKCVNSVDPNVSLIACKGLVMLVECGILQLYTTLSELVSSLNLAKSYDGIITAICDLLLLDMNARIKTDGNYKCPFNPRSLQHPLILILDKKSDLWFDILNKLKYFYGKNNRQAYYANELLYPFYMYVICNPGDGVPEIFQHKLWKFIMRLDVKQSVNVIPYVLAWTQVSTKKQVLQTNAYLMDLSAETSQTNNELKEVLVLWLSYMLHELVKHKCDPREPIFYLKKTIQVQDVSNSASTILVILAETIVICPSVYLNDLLELCKTLIFLNKSNRFSNEAIKVALLQWIAHECSLTRDSLQTAHEIFLYIQNNRAVANSSTKDLYRNKLFTFLKSTNSHVHTVTELNVFSESLKHSSTLSWLKETEKLSAHYLKSVQVYFTSSFLSAGDDAAVVIVIIEILLKICKSYSELTPQLITLFLYKLSNTTNSDIHFKLLKSLPKLAVLNENLPLILNTLELVHDKRNELKSFAIALYYDLWQVDVKHYPKLQDLLMYSFDKSQGATSWWEFYVTKAFILKRICIKSPQLYGSELVGHLSEVLNKCGDQNGDLASALALDGITELCEAGIIDVDSTWNELAPKFNGETRTNVVKSLCKFLTETSFLEPGTYTERLLKDVLEKLWSYATQSKDQEIVCAAYKALSHFSLQQISEYLPSELKSYYKTTSTANSPMFGDVHGDCWIDHLKKSEIFALDSVGDFLIKFMSDEITDYRGGLYAVEENRREPQNYNHLRMNSVVRALGNHVRNQVQTWQNSPSNKAVYLQCLRVLSQEYSKPLPPADWCFLQELMHAPETRPFCITIASHQVQLSGTARRLMENYIEAMTQVPEINKSDILCVYGNLHHLCNSIQPMTLRPFLEKTVEFSLQEGMEQREELFVELLGYIKATLVKENLHEANKFVLSQIVVGLAKKIDVENALFDKLIESVTVLPSRYIEELSSPKHWKEPTEANLKVSLKIRRFLALNSVDSPLKWLDEVINAACFMPWYQEYVLINLAEIVTSYRQCHSAITWILEYLGHTQATIANENTSKSHLQFLCDVFIVFMVIVSGQDRFIGTAEETVKAEMERLRVFPQGIASLMETEQWKPRIAQISEWLFYMVNYDDTPQSYKISFYQSLIALRHKNVVLLKWMKYLGTSIPYNIQ